MSRKKVRDIAIVLVIVFIVTIIVYPLIFGTDPEPQKGPPVELQLDK